ncbi:hypothetical protein TNCT_68031 [Trichonephila clavata]|uniref:Uncharacterized protein n=1 Tax=Trichonephila clavata TaxID=2740835 RepID=A0A8X6HDC2_TRICU|nr:hypothetical protein TNCT_68031 [Trichonephila clavata]
MFVQTSVSAAGHYQRKRTSPSPDAQSRGFLYQGNNYCFVSSTLYAWSVTDGSQSCLRRTGKLSLSLRGIQWTRWTRIETCIELMT